MKLKEAVMPTVNGKKIPTFRYMKLKEALEESFNSAKEYEWFRRNDNAWEAKFTAGNGISYIIAFQRSTDPADDKKKSKWILEFVMDSKGEKKAKELTGKSHVLSWGITGTGNASEVFATVIAATKEFVIKVKPDILGFSSEEPSRTKLYRSMIQFISKKIGYKPKRDYKNGQGDINHFELEKA